MLVFGRKLGEAIVVIDAQGVVIAEVMVTRIGGDKVRLSTDAPRSLTVHRREILPPDVHVGGKVPPTFLVSQERKEKA